MAGLVTLVLGALLLAQVCYTSAVPASNPSLQEDSTAVEGTATTYSIAGEHGKSGKNEYMLAMSSLRKIVRHTGCNTSFNGQPISPHYCAADLIKFSTPMCTCDQQLVVTVNQKVHEKVIGAELALYKLPEKYDAENSLRYKVSIHYRDLQTQPLAVRHIPASSSGWQVFHLKLPHDSSWLKERFNLILSISATGSHDGTPLSCSAVSPLFILNSKTASASGTGVSMKNQPSNPTPYCPMFVTFVETSQKCGNSPCAVALKRQKRRIIFLNNYIRNFYYQFVSIKQSNCSNTLLGQKVSYNLCRSNKIIFAPVQQHQAPSERNTSFKLCSSVSLPSTAEEILGRDLIIYKRALPAQNVMLEVFLIEVVNPHLEVLVANSTVQTNASGWQVFHIDSYTNVTEADRICIDVYVRVQENVTFLSKAELMDMFILDSYRPEEIDKTPLLTTFVYKRRSSYPLFRKKRLLQDVPSFPVGDKNTAACLFQDHIVNLSEYLQMTVVYPEAVNLGQCIGDSFMQQVRGIETEYNDSAAEKLRTSQCMPTQLEDLNVVVSEGIYTSLITLPKAITKDCGWDTY